jgi:hypothetical protein
LFFEFAYKDIRWEKRYFKKQINANKIDGYDLFFEKEPFDFYFKKDDEIDYINSFTDSSQNSAKYHFIRALLGLAEHYEFITQKNGQKTKDKYYINIVHENVEGEQIIERFQSPILYKVIDNNLYIIPKEIPDELWGAKFKFIYKIKYSNERNDSLEKEMTRSLPIPKKEEFNLIEFLDYSLQHEDISNKYNFKKI